ncbi:MAG TPA: [FeFe] hydrogenase H-cluster radical SAM maturase HydE [Thermotoga sp.]|nr:[FeFe] hydrogenase H-cluster radical SAM maturase HydE [Thermotoga sp.]
MKALKALEKITKNPDSADKEELTLILKENDKEFNEKLFKIADEIREKYVGNEVHVRALIEFSNYCRRDCLYCGLRRSNRKLKRYRMTPQEIIKRAELSAKMGAKTIVLQSGEDLYYTKEMLSDIIKEIKKFDVAITLSIGERTYEEYEMWKAVGADRFLMRHETANKKLYKELHPDSSFEERLKCLHWLKKLGYEVGAGNIVGLPGQTMEDLADDLLFVKELDADMVGIGPFIPHPQTPLKNEKRGDFLTSLKMIALARILLPDTNIPATTALGTIHPNGRQIALKCGANVIMPIMTPSPYRPLYQLYPGKICVFEDDTKCIPCVFHMIKALGREVGKSYGSRKRINTLSTSSCF